jgi:hypothetical protein
MFRVLSLACHKEEGLAATKPAARHAACWQPKKLLLGAKASSESP